MNNGSKRHREPEGARHGLHEKINTAIVSRWEASDVGLEWNPNKSVGKPLQSFLHVRPEEGGPPTTKCWAMITWGSGMAHTSRVSSSGLHSLSLSTRCRGMAFVHELICASFMLTFLRNCLDKIGCLETCNTRPLRKAATQMDLLAINITKPSSVEDIVFGLRLSKRWSLTTMTK